MKLCAALVNLPRLTAPRLYPAGQTLGQTAKFRQTTPEIGVSPGFATHFRPACPKTVKDPRSGSLWCRHSSSCILDSPRDTRRTYASHTYASHTYASDTRFLRLDCRNGKIWHSS